MSDQQSKTEAAAAIRSDVGLAVGSTIWVFDGNRRIYAKDGRGGPIYREHWRPAKITSETSRSWITDWGQKVPKKGERPGVCFTEKEVDEKSWVEDNHYKISDAVNRVRDHETLRAIAKLVGYETANDQADRS